MTYRNIIRKRNEKVRFNCEKLIIEKKKKNCYDNIWIAFR